MIYLLLITSKLVIILKMIYTININKITLIPPIIITNLFYYILKLISTQI